MSILKSGRPAWAAGVVAAGVGVAAWSLAVEPNWFTIREYELPLLPRGFRRSDAGAGDGAGEGGGARVVGGAGEDNGAGAALPDEIRILHISDQHQTAWQHRKPTWIAQLAGRTRPDMVVNTGDNFGGPTLATVLESQAALLELPGAFVLGSNDYFGPRMKNPLRYLAGPSDHRNDRRIPDLPTDGLLEAYRLAGWARLDNAAAVVEVAGARVALSGLADAHIDLDAEDAVTFPRDADVRIGVTHAPYQRVLHKLARAGSDLVLAGHTHGGQVRVPFWGAPATNCDLPHDMARGLFRFADTRVEVSAGLGVSPTAPVRFSCLPEVSLIHLTAGSD